MKAAYIAVGMEFILPKPHGSSEGIVPIISGAMFDICYWIRSPKEDDVRTWSSGAFRYGAFVNRGIPFFLLHFLDTYWNLDFHLLTHLQLEAGLSVDDFINKPGNLMNMFLIDAETNILLGMRGVGLRFDVVNEIKAACAKQLQIFTSSRESTAVTDSILSAYSGKQMRKFTTMYLNGR